MSIRPTLSQTPHTGLMYNKVEQPHPDSLELEDIAEFGDGDVRNEIGDGLQRFGHERRLQQRPLRDTQDMYVYPGFWIRMIQFSILLMRNLEKYGLSNPDQPRCGRNGSSGNGCKVIGHFIVVCKPSVKERITSH
jgi:hypothetical protein